MSEVKVYSATTIWKNVEERAHDNAPLISKRFYTESDYDTLKSELSAKDARIKELVAADTFRKANERISELEQKLAEANERVIEITKNNESIVNGLLDKIKALEAENEKLNEENAELLAQKLQQLTKSTELQSSGKGG